MISLQELHDNPRSIWIEDMHFFHQMQAPDYQAIGEFCAWLSSQKWFRRLMGKKKGVADYGDLGNAFNRARDTGADPSWFGYIPRELHRMLEVEYLSQSIDSPQHVQKVSFTGMGFIVEDGGLVNATSDAMHLGRLNNVRQLASLQSPVTNEESFKSWGFDFCHTRFGHSLEVCGLATLIGERCGITGKELALLRIAAMSHDGLTPAGGDTIKAIDPKAFDEDVQYPNMFNLPKWPELRDRYQVDEDRLVQTILGNGLLGTILDIADKISYVGRDLHEFMNVDDIGSLQLGDCADLCARILSLLARNPDPCAVWSCAELRKGELVFTDKYQIADFFTARALITRVLYNNPMARLGEAAFVGPVAKMLYRAGVITREFLLGTGDLYLFRVMGNALGVDAERFMSLVPNSQNPMVDTFATLDQAREFERQEAREPNRMTHLEVSPKPSTGCLDKFKVVDGRRVRSFRRTCPAASYEIEQIFRNERPFWVYSYTLDDVLFRNKDFRSRLLESRDKRVSGGSE